MELEHCGPVDLTDPASSAAGQPWESYRWLRGNDPVYFHPEPMARGSGRSPGMPMCTL